MEAVEREWGVSLIDYSGLWRWSVDQPEQFWRTLWDFTGIISETRGDVDLESGHDMITAKFFPKARLNFAENILRRRDDHTACVFWREDGFKRHITWEDLYDQVSKAQQLLIDLDVARGDRVVAFLPNIPEALVFMLATTSIGGIWSSCSPDFGAQGTLDRIGQIDPKVLISVDGYFYGGKRFPIADRLKEIVTGISSLKHVVLVDYIGEGSKSGQKNILGENLIHYPEAVFQYRARDITFERYPFDEPAFVLYTSGTTGNPKCIIHSAGRSLIKLLKEHVLHFDVKPDDRFFYFTTTGWNMWYTLVTALGAGGVPVIYDGSPFFPKKDILFDMVDDEGIAIFGTSPKYLDAIMKEGLAPRKSHDLHSLKTILSTGSPLAPVSFDYVYECIKKKIRLSSISGGTEIMATLANGNPIGPVWRGELQAPTLGMKTTIFDEQGHSIVGKRGELVCVAPFPSRPLKFWNDPGNQRYHETYYSRFPNTWCHGDFAEITEHGGLIIHGRSDATLNPGGIRIGTADIYRAVESLASVVDSIVVGQQWNGEERVILFVKLGLGVSLDGEIESTIRETIQEQTTRRHVPAKIFQVEDIPYTINGKKLELAVRDIIHDKPVRNVSSIANPKSLDCFANFEIPQS